MRTILISPLLVSSSTVADAQSLHFITTNAVNTKLNSIYADVLNFTTTMIGFEVSKQIA